MKSSYELAMERLGKETPPARKLTKDQIAKIADLDSLYRSKIAEAEILMKPKILEARNMGDANGMAELERQLANELRKLHEESEREKEKVRNLR